MRKARRQLKKGKFNNNMKTTILSVAAGVTTGEMIPDEQLGLILNAVVSCFTIFITKWMEKRINKKKNKEND